MSLNFNDESEKPRFISKPNPLVAGSHQIFEYQPEKGKYEPVGDYTLIDKGEDLDITAKKVMNLISLMNGRKPLISFENLTQERVLFTINTDSENADTETIVFRTYKGEGVSRDNAVLKVKKGVFNDETNESDPPIL